MIVSLGNNNIYTNDNLFILKSICDLKKVREEEVVLIIGNDINTDDIIYNDIYIDEVLMTLKISYVIIKNKNNNLIKTLNDYKINFIFLKYA